MNTSEAFRNLTAELGASGPESRPAYALAELNDLLTAAEGDQIPLLDEPPIADSYLANYVAAMVELAAHRRGVLPPSWTSAIAPLPEPRFAVPWMSLRPHLLLESPVPFRRRNIFINASLGDRV